ncbi:extracellular solute-binding protein [Methylosinus sp. Sm6]|uniref:extracellular solute-binding protein n=1 Tax=Methylosinus sp. Sm6 TaxID=2866948 RepID=UPI001C99D9DE|nr:extracellular solute-binding protein [Methylosinus sp. Sm6]MBY6241611.1 extracellular solute-binding protein [Methylosinus sp. Sm6]
MDRRHSPLLTRRGALRLGAAALLAAPARGAAAQAGGEYESHGLSIFGDLELPVDFDHFPYADPAAPIGGTLILERPATKNDSFDSLNGYILRGNPAAGLELLFDRLMAPSLDEPDAVYGLVARSVRVSADRSTYTFFLRPEARFHDGSPLTAHDVAFSLEALKKDGHPLIALPLRDMTSATASSDHELVVAFAPERPRELPVLVASQPIFSKAYYQAHKFAETTLEAPLGSGRYRIAAVEPGRYVVYERVADYWGAELPVNRGQGNFATIRYDYFADAGVAFEAFKAGTISLHEEFRASYWATGYDFPAMRQGRVEREEIPDRNASGAQGYFLNARRPIFQDARIRRALVYAFDFEWTNRNLFHGAYRRTTSYFENSDLKAEGPPGADEVALLEPFRDKAPKEVFGEPFRPPASDGSGQDRALLRKASDLLAAAGCTRRDGVLLLPDGAPFRFEFLQFSSFYEKITQPYIKNLRLLGITATERVVDSAQYKRRVDEFDYDVRTERLRITHSPGEELRALFGSEQAGIPGTRNISGVADPVVDALIAKALQARTRAELATVCRALDRVLIAGAYWVPHWYKPSFWLAYWDMFGRPARAPRYDPGVAQTWWVDTDKAEKLKMTGR